MLFIALIEYVIYKQYCYSKNK